jgi:hypothetical protein
MTRYSVAVPAAIAHAMQEHLIRGDGQEDVLIATYLLSTGRSRTTALIQTVIFPEPGERLVHGSASFTSGYVLRAANQAQALGHGLVLLHSHPSGRNWQGLSRPDHDTESGYLRIAEAVTKQPLVGMTLGGVNDAWSARFWFAEERPTWAESVRVVGSKLQLTWNEELRPAPTITRKQKRTVSSWGATAQASIGRLRVLVVGAGSVGLDVAQRLSATGLADVGVMDFDAVEAVNLDRMIGATRLDAALGRGKAAVAARLMRSASTAARFTAHVHEESITDPVGVASALDYDVIISCVDGPWARAVLNALSYTDLIPVIDGGIAIETFPDGRMRGASWRSHTLVPGQPCMLCTRQLDVNEVTLDKQGLLDKAEYIAAAGRAEPSHQNVAALSASVSAALLAQFVSLVAHPAQRGTPGPLRYTLSTHTLEHLTDRSAEGCRWENPPSVGDARVAIAEHRDEWRHIVTARQRSHRPFRLRALAALEGLLQQQIGRL